MVDYWSDEEKFFNGVITMISRQYHKSPSEIKSWTLPDLTLILASLFEESKMNEKLQKEFDSSMASR